MNSWSNIWSYAKRVYLRMQAKPEKLISERVSKSFPCGLLRYVVRCKAMPGRNDTALSRNRHHLNVFDNEKQIAFASWTFDIDFVQVLEIKVCPEYQRKGIATTIYDTLRKITQLKLKWIRNAIASSEMKYLVTKYCDQHTVLSDDGNTIVLVVFK